MFGWIEWRWMAGSGKRAEARWAYAECHALPCHAEMPVYGLAGSGLK